ncbi:MAG: hypothetical protein NFW17_13845 [Candidatus Accumulibacter sp.]|uniref:hypothetical protein n=1 Tax=Accumulibacter sp. TaxID=2053492 RepID=UPI0025D4B094|nr:hypothetical protein [Accumulibacter sp.]MCM8613147.1 hypothetical protein [Accumulibacter sp.]MCM8640200.1 hypothetical protein [Accumulibacter sp.]
MTARFFADTNIVVYSLDEDSDKRQCCFEILRRRPVISVQVITGNRSLPTTPRNGDSKLFLRGGHASATQHTPCCRPGTSVQPEHRRPVQSAGPDAAYQPFRHGATAAAHALVATAAARRVFGDEVRLIQVIHPQTPLEALGERVGLWNELHILSPLFSEEMHILSPLSAR